MEISEQVESEQVEEESLLFYLVYCSRQTRPFTEADIDQLVAVAQRNNARQNITGWLVYSSGIFFQWLEGGRHDVQRLMLTIVADERHDTIVVLSEEEEVRERLFSKWDMELVSAEDIRAVLQDAIDTSDDPKCVGALRMLLEELDSKSIATAATSAS
jgi:Sensors of blue-light using FAD